MPKQPIHIATYQEAAKPLAQKLPNFDHSVVIRLGGVMPYAQYDIHINTPDAIKNSICKLTQKKLLLNAGLATLPLLKEPVYPCVLKGRVRSCGTKVLIVNNAEEFKKAATQLKQDYLIETLFTATSEYRFHCTRDKVFFEVRK